LFLNYASKLVWSVVLFHARSFRKSPVYQNISLSKCLTFLAVLFQVLIAGAQVENILNKVDSIKQLIPEAKGVDKYKAVFQVAYELFEINNTEAAEYANRAYELALQLGDSAEIARSGRLSGQLLRRVGRSDEAISRFIEVLPIAERNKIIVEQKRILNALAVAYIHTGEYDKALHFNFKSLEIREKEGNKKEISLSLTNIGTVYYKIGDFEQALEFNNRALEALEQAGDKSGMDHILMNISLCYVYLADYDKAKEFANRAFDSCGNDCSDLIKEEGEFCLGIVFSHLSEFDLAASHFNNSLLLAKQMNDLRYQVENLSNLADIALKKKDYDKVIEMLKETELISKKAGYNQMLISVYFSFSDLYGQLMDFEKEALYQKKYIRLKDSVYSDQLIKNLAKVQNNYQERENLKTIAEQDEVLKLKEEVIARQKTQYFFILTITILSILLTFVFIRFNRSQQQANVDLARAKREIEDKNQELEISNAALDARVQERTIELQQSNQELQKVNDELDNFIYKTSHDIRGPLASLKGMTNVAMLDVKDATALAYFKKLDISAEKLNSILTRLVTVNHINHVTLIPERIDCQELIEDILTLERKKGIPAKMAITYNCDQEVILMTDRSVLRLALENLIDNAIKFYSDSKRIEPFVKIEVKKSKPLGNAEIVVTDNGIGIQESDQQKLFHMFMRASERSETGGIGLYLAKLSTEKLGGQINFTVTSEGYTQFSIQLPSDFGRKQKQV
jgi:signal transduction histidine kinase